MKEDVIDSSLCVSSPDLQVKAATMRRRDYLKITAALSDTVGGDRKGGVKPKPVEKIFNYHI